MSVATFHFDGARNARSKPRKHRAVGSLPGRPMKQPPIQSAHVDDTVQAIARLRADHDQKATPLERTVDRLTGRAASPRFVVLLSLVLVSWIGLNTILLLIGRRPLDEPPFFWIQLAALAAGFGPAPSAQRYWDTALPR
jgi:hypothetical protein